MHCPVQSKKVWHMHNRAIGHHARLLVTLQGCYLFVAEKPTFAGGSAKAGWVLHGNYLPTSIAGVFMSPGRRTSLQNKLVRG